MIVDLGQLSAIGCTKWQSDKEYKKGQMVIEDSDLYTALVANRGHNPSEESYWEKNTNLKELMDDANYTVEAAKGVNRAIEEANAARDEANNAAQYAIEYIDGTATSKIHDAEIATVSANNAANTALSEAQKANDATVNANQAAANGNTQYNTLKNYHDNVTIPDHNRADQDHNRANADHYNAVSDHSIANTDHTNVTTNWRNEFTDAQAARAAEFNRTQQEKQAIFDSKEAERDAAIAEVTTYESKMDYLLHLFGQYATPAPQSLVIDPTRKDVAISSESMSEVTAQGWAISQPIVIRKGNIYRIKVGEASGQYVTTAMRYQYRDEQGNLRYAYKRKTQLDEHSELPVDGYLIMYGLPRDYELVVCFKYTAQYDPVVEVLTAGLLRTLAFQLGDMQDMIDQKLDVNGHSSAASVGGAMALLQKGDVPEDTYSELLTARMIGNAPDLMHVHGSTDTRTGIDDGKDVNVVVEKVWGDVIGGNQMFNPDLVKNTKGWSLQDQGDATYSLEDGFIKKTLVRNSTNNQFYRGSGSSENMFEANKAYMVLVEVVTSARTQLAIYRGKKIVLGYAEANATSILGVIDTSSNEYNLFRLYDNNANTMSAGDWTILKKYILLDLTTLFPTDTSFVTSLTQSDAIKVAHRLGFAAFTLD